MRKRTGLTNNVYYSQRTIMKSREIRRQIEIKLCKTLIRSVLWYGARLVYGSRLQKRCLMHLREKF